MCCQSNPPRKESAPWAITNRWMKRRWKEGHEIATAVLCPFAQSEGENHANQKTILIWHRRKTGGGRVKVIQHLLSDAIDRFNTHQ